VASLHDTHDSFTLPSDFVATLGFTVDIYDGAVLIDSINRAALPAATFPFAVGDRLISVDGRAVDLLLTDFVPYVASGNPIAARRQSAGRITTRSQVSMPHAPDLAGKQAVVVIQRQNGAEETYTIPWISSGTPLTVGPVPSPKAQGAPVAKSAGI